jgi:Xaa-Pro dipeptidase
MVAEDFESILNLRKYPGKLHIKRTLERMSKSVDDLNGILYLEATHTKLQEDDDNPVPFR